VNDTPPFIEHIYRQKIMEKSDEERLTMGSCMFDAAREMVLSSFPQNMSLQEKRKSLFLRFYSNDFDENTKQSILQTLSEKI
jgi:hypothetical protein